jgi:lipopolysaccharide transport system permease protein
MNQIGTPAARPFVHIKPKRGFQLIDIKEIKEYRDLFYFLVVRDIKVRYKQTVLGGLWSILQPFFSMVVFSLFFGKLARIPSDGVPYPIFNFTAMVAWTYFSNAVTGSGNSLIGNNNLISKVYFPRIMIPLTPVIAGLLDFFIALAILIFLMFYFHIFPTLKVFLLPFLLFLMVLIASGVGTFFAALNAKYRDTKYAIPLLMNLWMFVSPVVYPVSMIPEKYRFIYSLNPLSGIIEGFRSILLGTVPFPTEMILFSGSLSLVLFIIGISYFRQMERSFADII